MEIKKQQLNEQLELQLTDLSKEFARENICQGYFVNGHDDYKDEIIYCCYDNNNLVGYLFGHKVEVKEKSMIINKPSTCFEIVEIFVCKEYRNLDIGSKLFSNLEEDLDDSFDYITLVTSTRDYKKILNFYVDKLGMTFWYARLFKELK